MGSTTAWGFCGTYVGTEPGAVTNHTSRMVVVRNGNQTVLTMANDYDATEAGFGMLVPVPSGYTLDDLSVTDGSALEALEAYTAVPMVALTCDQMSWSDV